MKLLYLCNLVPRKLGAFEDFLVGIGEGLKAGGDEFVCVFAGEPCYEVAAKLAAVGATWHTIPQWVQGERVHPWAVCLPAFKIILREKPDVVAVHFGNELPTILLITLVSLATVGTKTVRWVWHQRQQIRDPGTLTRHLSVIRVASWFFDHIVVSYLGALRSLRLRGVSEKKVSVIYNSLREAHDDDAGSIRDELGVSDTAVVITNVGWLVPRKRIDLAIRAFAEVDRQCNVAAHLLIVGDGPQIGELQSLVDSLGVCDKVSFVGMRSDVRNILAQTDIHIHTSMAETCTNVVQEAMAAGCPTVMMEAGAAREQILDGKTGYVVGRDDFESLCGKLKMLVEDAALRKTMGEVARRRWYSVFRLSISVEKHCELYRSLCRGEVRRQLPAVDQEDSET